MLESRNALRDCAHVLVSRQAAMSRVAKHGEDDPAGLGGKFCDDSAAGQSKMVDRSLRGDRIAWRIDFLDTVGQEHFDRLHAPYYVQANACISVFDVTRKVAYNNLETWFEDMWGHCPDIPVTCIANKIVELGVAKAKIYFRGSTTFSSTLCHRRMGPKSRGSSSRPSSSRS